MVAASQGQHSFYSFNPITFLSLPLLRLLLPQNTTLVCKGVKARRAVVVDVTSQQSRLCFHSLAITFSLPTPLQPPSAHIHESHTTHHFRKRPVQTFSIRYIHYSNTNTSQQAQPDGHQIRLRKVQIVC
jgi:hypothetical protein